MNSNPIGVFDSGIGGLTVVKEIIQQLPNENIIYIGDTARVPYGTRGKEVIEKFALELVNFLLKKNVKVLIVACNTISATCLDEIKKISPVAVIGVINPAINSAIKTTKNNRIGVIGTTATISSKIYEKGLGKEIKVTSKACPLFVPLTEEGLKNHPAAKLIAKDYLKKISKSSIDTLILGCTHYPILKEVIQNVVGKKVKLVDSAKPTAKELKALLEEKGLRNGKKNPKYDFYVTDITNRTQEIAEKFFGNNFSIKLIKTLLT